MTARSFFMSPIESIDNMKVSAIPSKPLKNVTAIRIDRTVVLIDEQGRLYSTQVQGSYSYTPSDNSESLRATITGAAKLGAISEKAMTEDLERRQAAARERSKAWAAQSIVDHANALGIKFTEAQRRRIDAATPAAKGGAA